jgi:hypothetical protein
MHMLEGLTVSSIEGTEESSGIKYAIIKTALKKRSAQIQGALNYWNQQCPRAKIFLHPLESSPPVCTFFKSADEGFSNHHIVKRIIEDKAKKAAGSPSNYFSSNDTEIEEDPMLMHPDAMDSVPTTTGKRAAHTTSSAAAAKCSKTDEEIAAIIAEKDREIEKIRSEKDKEKDREIEKVRSEKDKEIELKAQEIERLQSQAKTFEKIQEFMVENGGKMDKIQEFMVENGGKMDKIQEFMVENGGKMDQIHVGVQTVIKTKEQFEAQEAKNNDLQAQHERDRELIASDAAKRGHLARKTNSLEEELEKRVSAKELIEKMGEGLVEKIQTAIYETHVQRSLVQTGVIAAFTDEWVDKAGYERFPEFKARLIDIHLSKPGILYRRPEVHTNQIPSDTAIRMYMDFMVQLGFKGEYRFMRDTTHRHRFNLACYDGPIYSEITFMEIRSVYLAHVDFLYSQLCIKNYFDPPSAEEFSPDPHAFQRPEVLYLCI